MNESVPGTSDRPGTVASAPLSSRETRRRYEQRQKRRSTLIALTSTLVVIGLLVTLIPRTPGWYKVKRSFFNGNVFSDTFPRLLDAFVKDVQIFLWCAPCILVWGMVLAVCRSVRTPALFPLRLFSAAYTDIFRGVPVILTILLIGFGVPGLGMDRPWNSPYLWGSVALVLTYSSYVAEVFRAGIESVHESQRAGARSLGLSSGQTLRFVVIPQAVRRVVPPLMNDFVSLQKDVALVSLIGPIEILRQAGVDKSKYANFTPYVGAALIFLALTIPETRFVDHLMARERRRTSGTVIK
ncbi:MAG: amino acid ABC transporter permease [Acidimicrobiia bacterium]|jgi:polar amino acid transport system permease protein|nr:amino acid ABC transporter permease [Actinomycetota bacterium]NDE57860.1 amino acid ABC transporter permease [Acidimicrobiia bacterium]NDA76847.1 amino acid ABC transporter permease [Actinomycetota bacterium]NDD96816.1 amino acid ABC transporter permease [Actinomycetota bacterium]NDE80545.1 amino acid ABC transporter permease [Actinomycetota bacterium]